MSVSFLRSETFLACPICYEIKNEIFAHDRIHQICLDCLQKHLSFNRPECPQCRRAIDNADDFVDNVNPRYLLISGAVYIASMHMKPRDLLTLSLIALAAKGVWSLSRPIRERLA